MNIYYLKQSKKDVLSEKKVIIYLTFCSKSLEHSKYIFYEKESLQTNPISYFKSDDSKVPLEVF